VFVLILVNVLVFLFEISAGGWNDPKVLHRIGAVPSRTRLLHNAKYWRLFHWAFSTWRLFASRVQPFSPFYVLGPPLERSIGTIRFLACYLISGLASGAGVVALKRGRGGSRR